MLRGRPFKAGLAGSSLERRLQSMAAFTVVELLTTVGIVLVLASLVFPMVSKMTKRAEAVAEIGGGRNLIAAWHSYANDNDGTILPGYLNAAQTSGATVQNAQGQSLGFPTGSRYPFRLAPYLGYQFKGTTMVNKQKKYTDDYRVSMAPSMGMNLTFVGGDFGTGSDKIPNDENFSTYGKFVVTKLAEIVAPSKLIVFASARYKEGSTDYEGYNAVKSPYLTGQRWPDAYDENRSAYDYGSVHPRFGNKTAICAMADGHLELVAFKDLFDMRRWSNQAAQADDPNWTLQPISN